MKGVLSSLRYLLSDFIGDDDDAPPFLPEGLPDRAAAVVSDAIHMLIDYQGPSYARLYVDRLRRFIGRRGVDDAMLIEIARLMAMRMSYEDPIRIAQLKLAELATADSNPRLQSTDDVRRFRVDELIGALNQCQPLAHHHRRVRLVGSDRPLREIGGQQARDAVRLWAGGCTSVFIESVHD